jgi:hypothetical protein
MSLKIKNVLYSTPASFPLQARYESELYDTFNETARRQSSVASLIELALKY